MKMRFLMALMCATVFIFTSCDKDDDPVIPKTPPVGAKWIDPDFAEFLMEEGLITDAKTVTPDDVAKITKINCEGKNLTSLRGIEYFTALTELWCNDNNLTTLDVSKNTKLTTLSCGYNNLTTLDVSKNTKLTGINCHNNHLTKLDVSKNTKLESLYCVNNNLTTLDFSKNAKLTSLNCMDNNLTTLDISKNAKLSAIWCNNNNLTTLDISNNTRLTILDCEGNPGVYGVFEVKAWFDNSNILIYASTSWTYDGRTVKINYVKV